MFWASERPKNEGEIYLRNELHLDSLFRHFRHGWILKQTSDVKNKTKRKAFDGTFHPKTLSQFLLPFVVFLFFCLLAFSFFFFFFFFSFLSCLSFFGFYRSDRSDSCPRLIESNKTDPSNDALFQTKIVKILAVLEAFVVTLCSCFGVAKDDNAGRRRNHRELAHCLSRLDRYAKKSFCLQTSSYLSLSSRQSGFESEEVTQRNAMIVFFFFFFFFSNFFFFSLCFSFVLVWCLWTLD